VIAGEQKLLGEQQRRAAGGMAGDRDGEQVGRQRHRLITVERPLDVHGRGAEVGPVQDALAAELAPKNCMIGDVVTMREEHRVHAAQRREPRQERLRGARRVDQHVAGWPPDEVAGRPE
jgi:hypothetical protein